MKSSSIAAIAMVIASAFAFDSITVNAKDLSIEKDCELKALKETSPVELTHCNIGDLTPQCKIVIDEWIASAAIEKRRHWGSARKFTCAAHCWQV